MDQKLTVLQAIQLAMDHHAARRYAEAEALYRQVLAQSPDHPAALQMLGRLAHEVGKTDAAIQILTRAVQVDPRSAGAFNFRGNAYAACGKFHQAAADFQQAISINPQFAEAYNNLGNVMREMSHLDGAARAYEKALSLKPNYAMTHSNLAITYKDQGRVAEAIASFDRALALNPDDAITDSNRLYSLQFLPDITPQRLFDEHRQWAQRRVRNRLAPVGHSNDRSPDRVLRIGYLSSDLRYHSVAFFLLPLLRSHDRRRHHITCYPTTAYNDNFTAQFRACCDEWRPLLGVPDAAAAQVIRNDRIDILVDLTGHTSNGRLPLLMAKPAPVQVSYLGYPNTTGLETMDWRLTDALADPPGSEAFYTEKLYRLPRTAWCFAPLSGQPPVEPIQRPGITFGSFNDMAKMNQPLLRLWSRVLGAVPGSRLMIKNRATNSPVVCDQFRARAAEFGIPADRLDLIPPVAAPEQHLRAYGQVDIALDTFPYHGATTTCESLWMGVPVVTLAGSAHVSRVGVSLLSSVGLADLIAGDESAYVSIAAALAADAGRRRDLRMSLRDRLQGSALMNGGSLAREVEAAYQKMWRDYVNCAPSVV
ncbi:MAG TPA: tetratricopeptide repeat protein [Tepidisphaeraceae bacterium]|nr:tetratricopeptide repeat protein [Tepidisphaeraceae bacterium]